VSTVRHYPYTCAACGRSIESTTSLFVCWETRGNRLVRQIRVCRSAKKCGNPARRAELLGVGT